MTTFDLRFTDEFVSVRIECVSVHIEAWIELEVADVASVRFVARRPSADLMAFLDRLAPMAVAAYRKGVAA